MNGIRAHSAQVLCRSLLTVMTIAMALLATSVDVEAQCWIGKLLADDGAALDNFGNALDSDGERLIVGAYRDDDGADNAGAAYVYRAGAAGWELEAKLVADDGAEDDAFGISVAISGDYALVGAYWEADLGSQAGAAYVFAYDGRGWSQVAKLWAEDGAAGDNFGVAVALDGDTAVIGAQRDDDRGSDAGAVYIFQRDGEMWMQQSKLLPDENANGGNFGAAVDVAASYLAVGALRDDEAGNDAGAAYVFERTRDGWDRDTKIVAADGAPYDTFGVSVACDGTVLVVGAAQEDDQGSNSGAAYVYRRSRSGWEQVEKLYAADGAEGNRFGTAVSVQDGDTPMVLVGSPQSDSAGSNDGAVYFFQEVGGLWGQSARLMACDGASSDFYGAAVVLVDDTAIVGVTGDDDNGGNSGSVYVQRTRLSPDLNDDGQVSLADLQLLLTNYERLPDQATCFDGDVDGDCDVDLDDLLALLENYGLILD